MRMTLPYGEIADAQDLKSVRVCLVVYHCVS
jgi:hypothetical protein